MPEEVKEEFLGIEPTARQNALKTAPWLRTFPQVVQPPPLIPIKLDPGEAAVIALAIEHNARLVIIDEQRARRYAQHIPLLIQMQTNGIYLGKSVIEEALQQAGERD